MSKYIQTAKEPLLTLKRYDHMNCKAIPLSTTPDGRLWVKMIYCTHLKEDRKLLITREDI